MLIFFLYVSILITNWRTWGQEDPFNIHYFSPSLGSFSVSETQQIFSILIKIIITTSTSNLMT